MYFDGSVMTPGSGAGVVFISPDGSRLCYAICLHFSASNNTAEYEALINGLRIIIEQVMKESSCKSPLMAAYYQEVCKLEDKF